VSALAGRRVVVTRPRARAAALCEALDRRGAVVIEFPVIATVALAGGELDAALQALARYDWIAFTSAAAVEAVAARRAALGVAFDVPVAAVGPATRDAALAAGIAVQAMPRTFRGAELAGAMGPLAGRRVLLPASTIARPETAAALRAAGARVDEVFAYQTCPVAPPPAAFAALAAGVDAITFASPSAVAAFHHAAGLAPLRGAAIACIGPTTSDAVRALGVEPQVEPAAFTSGDLAAALEQWFVRVALTEGAAR
jgi:uroporphyrinogen-III synthase